MPPAAEGHRAALYPLLTVTDAILAMGRVGPLFSAHGSDVRLPFGQPAIQIHQTRRKSFIPCRECLSILIDFFASKVDWSGYGGIAVWWYELY